MNCRGEFEVMTLDAGAERYVVAFIAVFFYFLDSYFLKAGVYILIYCICRVLRARRLHTPSLVDQL